MQNHQHLVFGKNNLSISSPKDKRKREAGDTYYELCKGHHKQEKRNQSLGRIQRQIILNILNLTTQKPYRNADIHLYTSNLMRREDSLEKTLMLGSVNARGEGDNRG